MINQFTSHLMMVRPAAFGYNEQTATTNLFQQHNINLTTSEIQYKALQEFDAYVSKLLSKGLDITVIEDSKIPHKPDAIFPNNWISMHQDGTIYLYPMCTENRRLERRLEIIAILESNFLIKNIIDISSSEKDNRYLEGTGSIIFDHENRIAYAGISQRTDGELFEELCISMGYKPISFRTSGDNHMPIYHTNVMLTIGKNFALIGSDFIIEQERTGIINNMLDTYQDVIHLTHAQIHAFAGNMLQVGTPENHYLVMSHTACKSLTAAQKSTIEKHTEILDVHIDTIEKIGGGSARCMLAEIFLPTL
jgi:hypothetical protein